MAVGEKRAQEALDELKEKGIPVYGACIRDTALDHINSFGEFARRSGGDVHVFEADQARGVLEEIRGELTQAEVLEFAAPTNRITNEYETFSLRIQGQDAPLTREVLSCRWIPDEEAPVILEAVKGEERQILVTFSEPVSGADQTSAYTLTRRGEDGGHPVRCVCGGAERPGGAHGGGAPEPGRVCAELPGSEG